MLLEFFDGGDAFVDVFEADVAETDHAAFDGDAFNFAGGGAAGNGFRDARIAFEHLEDGDAAVETDEIAFFAAGACIGAQPFGFLLCESHSNKQRHGHRRFFRTMLANPANQPLIHHQRQALPQQRWRCAQFPQQHDGARSGHRIQSRNHHALGSNPAQRGGHFRVRYIGQENHIGIGTHDRIQPRDEIETHHMVRLMDIANA